MYLSAILIAMQSRNIYLVPLDKQYIQPDKGKSPAHTGLLQHAIDYECKEGTPIKAAERGIVVFLKQDSDEGGPEKKYWFCGNRIVLKHTNGEYTAYEHLQYHGAVVHIGQKVKQGELIGYSGNTGYSFNPHLHFEVFINSEEDESEGETIIPRFTNSSTI